jgi:hypothetical protein
MSPTAARSLSDLAPVKRQAEEIGERSTAQQCILPPTAAPCKSRCCRDACGTTCSAAAAQRKEKRQKYERFPF